MFCDVVLLLLKLSTENTSDCYLGGLLITNSYWEKSPSVKILKARNLLQYCYK